MTRDDARRAALLSNAWEDFADWCEIVVSVDGPESAGYTQVVMDLSVMETGDDPTNGGSGFGGGQLYIDLETARKLAPMVQNLIREELIALGVDVQLVSPEEGGE